MTFDIQIVQIIRGDARTTEIICHDAHAAQGVHLRLGAADMPELERGDVLRITLEKVLPEPAPEPEPEPEPAPEA